MADDLKETTRAQAAVGVAFTNQQAKPVVRLTAPPSVDHEIHLQLFTLFEHKLLRDLKFEILEVLKIVDDDNIEGKVIFKGITDVNGVLHANPPGLVPTKTYAIKVARLFFANRAELVSTAPIGRPPTPYTIDGAFVDEDPFPPLFGPAHAPVITDKKKLIGGRQFLEDLTKAGLDVIGLDSHNGAIHRRDEAIFQALIAGHMPDFCRAWGELAVSFKDSSGEHKGTVRIMPDCLAVGTNDDWIRVNISGFTSQRLADFWGCLLPTFPMLRAVLVVAPHQLHGHNIGAFDAPGNGDGRHQISNQLMRLHEDIIQGIVSCDGSKPLTPEQTAEMDDAKKKRHFNALLKQHGSPARCTLGPRKDTEFVSGHKKEVVIPYHTDQLTFGGMWKGDKAFNSFIQSESAPHGTGFTDYSQGSRLVHPVMEVDGNPMPTAEVLMHATLHKLLYPRPLLAAELRYPNPPPKPPLGG